jgi:ferrous iron transport protein B
MNQARPNKEIIVALAGNPNSGKTSIFNALTGAHQRVANFPGVTVEKRTGFREYGGHRFEFVDLPGTYNLAASSPDERVARDFILDENPDLVINVIDSGSLERGLHFTLKLIEMGLDVIIVLNMWDEAQKAGIEIEVEKLSRLLGAPVVRTVGNRGEGVEDLLAAAANLVDNRNAGHRHPPISYGPRLDDLVTDLSKEIAVCGSCKGCDNHRWLAVKFLEGDREIGDRFLSGSAAAPLRVKTERFIDHIKTTVDADPEYALSEGRHGYVAGVLREVMKPPSTDRMQLSVRIDNLLTHRVWGYPIFLLIMWLIFQATFKLGAYPMDWIGVGVAWLQRVATMNLPAGIISGLLADGIIGGVGAVAVFLPNIVILFMGIALLEDSGYMARAAFLMDRLMHFVGLHGKSFIPLLMGFGCNVPAIMAARTLQSPRDRILTILLIPTISCSARLPVYILFAGAFFGAHAGNVIFSVYLIGIGAAIFMARLYRTTFLRTEETPFVMELPPYRRPTWRSILIHMAERTKIYLRKMGGIILVASVVLWALGHFPVKEDFSQDYDGLIAAYATQTTPEAQVEVARLKTMKDAEELEYSLIGRFGKALHPIVRPLGFTWEMGIALVSGFVAKEVVVSTLGVLYHLGNENDSLAGPLQEASSGITKVAAYAFMIFILLYTPCLAAIIAVKREIGAKWMWLSVCLQAVLAWVAAFTIFQGGRILGL